MRSKFTVKNPFTLLKDENLQNLHGWKKIEYIWDYYKIPLFILGLFLYMIGYIIYGKLTYQDTALYTALVNVSVGEDLANGLSSDFLQYLELAPSKNKIELYRGLCLTDDESSPDHQYTYASGIKVLAMIEGQQLDVVIMNKEAFDAFSQNGYLYDLEELLLQEDPELYDRVQRDITDNIVILEDNAVDVKLDPSVSYSAVTEEHPYGIEISHTPPIEQAGFKDAVYLGIIANSPRIETAVAYLRYLYSM